MKKFSHARSSWIDKPQVTPPAELVPILDDDRGPATFFHGRERELHAFRERRKKAHLTNGGTIFLVQGAPGVGKTALLHECAQRAEMDGWRVADIDYNALYDPGTLTDQLDELYAEREIINRKRTVEGDVGITIAKGRFGKTEGQSSEYRGASVLKTLKSAAQSSGLVLVFDEAQTLHKDIGGPHDSELTRQLKLIHNGKVGAPVILLAGGLGISKSVFGTFGISRFVTGCVVNLGRLSPEAEREVIRDWLVKAGGAHGALKDLTHWIDTIAAETYGWPQHIQTYAPPAARWLRETGGTLTEQVPAEVLAKGHESKIECYESRVEGTKLIYRETLANLLLQKGPNASFREEELITAFHRVGGPGDAAAVFQHALYKGVVVERGDGRFAIPIPSMHTWMVQEYANPARDLPPMSPSNETPAAR